MRRKPHFVGLLIPAVLAAALTFGGCDEKREERIVPRVEQAPESPPGLPGEETGPLETAPASFSRLAKAASPSVVNVSAVKIVRGNWGSELPFRGRSEWSDPFREFFERFFGERMPRRFRQDSVGSGFIIDEKGYILTNNHVVEKTEEIEVTLEDGMSLKAEVVGRDPETDLALIRIETDKALKPIPLGNSETLEVGDWVVAIGSPFGLGHTVTAGIVSAKFRRIGAGAYDEFIQTDASINPGNSGGPLLNTRGEVVGVNSAIFSPSGGNIGIGFAVPINMAKKILPQLREGEVVRGWMGVSIQAVTPALADKIGFEGNGGALVSDIVEGGPADKAGIERGDVIVSYDGKEIKEFNDLPFMVATTPVGETVKVEVIRKGEQKKIPVKIARRERDQAT